MKYVSVLELRNNLAEILNLVASGNSSVVVTKHEKPVVMLNQYKETISPFAEFYGMWKDDGVSGEEYVNRIRRTEYSRKRTEYLRNRSKSRKK